MRVKQLEIAPRLFIVVAAALGAALGVGCGRDTLVSAEDAELAGTSLGESTIDDGWSSPSGVVEISANDDAVLVWPYTGTNFEGEPKDPINLVFAGKADVLEIRAALLALDGDRTAFGLPAEFPFNATWNEAIGNVQTAFADESWSGSVVQLEAGDYSTVRTHLRLFETDAAYGQDGVWTLGAAHFEITIPGTAEHQVVSWELAEQIVAIDLVRTGLLAAPPEPTPVINAAPTYRDIPAAIYNGLPDALKAVVGGPAGNVTDPVPIPSDGRGTLFRIAKSVPIVADSHTQDFTVELGQYIPKPFCSDPEDWIRVDGPVHHHKSVEVTERGTYSYRSSITGTILVTPVDMTQSPPAPIGEPYSADVRDWQSGTTSSKRFRVKFESQRVARPPGGTELLFENLLVGTTRNRFESRVHCLEPKASETGGLRPSRDR